MEEGSESAESRNHDHRGQSYLVVSRDFNPKHPNALGHAAGASAGHCFVGNSESFVVSEIH